MNIRKAYNDIAISMPATFVLALLVTYLYDLAVYGTAQPAWDVAFSISVFFGVLLPIATMHHGSEKAE